MPNTYLLPKLLRNAVSIYYSPYLSQEVLTNAYPRKPISGYIKIERL